MNQVAALRTWPVTASLPRPWGADVLVNHLVGTEVVFEDGATGHGWSWTPTIGASAVRALIDDDIAAWLVGRRADDPAETWDVLWAHLHEAGGGGVTTIAMAGVDLALWDAHLRRQGLGLPAALGRRHDTIPVYGSGVNLHHDRETLGAQAQRWVDDGFTAVKMKVGRPDLADDLERVALVRDVIGPDRALMVDANQRWDLATATVAIRALAAFDLRWVEEPLRADDTAGYARLRAAVDAPIAQGENAHTVHRFRDLIDAAAVDVVQPNVVRVGGITPFLRIAALARERGVEFAPHLLPELAGQVAVTLDEPVWVEAVEDADLTTLDVLVDQGPVQVRHGRLSVLDRVGLGIALRRQP